MKDVIEILKAAGEDTRLRIIALLAQGELAAQEISNVLGQSQPRVSRHIKLLAEAGIIEKRAEGSWVFAKLSSDPKLLSIINPIIDAIASDDHIIIKDTHKLIDIRKAREIVAQNYFDAIAPEWESLRKLQQPEKLVEEALLSLVKKEEFEFHIDLGAGTGNILGLFAEQAKRSEGIDKSRSMLALARSRLDEIKGANISIRMGDIFNLPYEDDVADLITIHQVLHYLDDPRDALKEAARIIKSNGILLIADFAPHQFEELRDKHGHKRLGFTQQEIQKWCDDCGFELVEHKMVGGTQSNKNEDKPLLNVHVMKFKMRAKKIKIDTPIKNNREFV